MFNNLYYKYYKLINFNSSQIKFGLNNWKLKIGNYGTVRNIDKYVVKSFKIDDDYFNEKEIYTTKLPQYCGCITKENENILQSGGVNQRSFSGNIKKESGETNKILQVYGGSYCNDIYKFLSNGIKRYEIENILNVELRPKFLYDDLNQLNNISPSKILSKVDRDELYQLYDKLFLPDSKKDTIANFYIWLVENNKCYIIDELVNKLDRLFGDNNPFKNDIYLLDPNTFLYNRKYIKFYPTYSNMNYKLKRDIIKQYNHDFRGIRM